MFIVAFHGGVFLNVRGWCKLGHQGPFGGSLLSLCIKYGDRVIGLKLGPNQLTVVYYNCDRAHSGFRLVATLSGWGPNLC